MMMPGKAVYVTFSGTKVQKLYLNDYSETSKHGEHVEETVLTESPAEDTAVEEPSLSELKETLVDIQITVSNILMENK